MPNTDLNVTAALSDRKAELEPLVLSAPWQTLVPDPDYRPIKTQYNFFRSPTDRPVYYNNGCQSCWCSTLQASRNGETDITELSKTTNLGPARII